MPQEKSARYRVLSEMLNSGAEELQQMVSEKDIQELIQDGPRRIIESILDNQITPLYKFITPENLPHSDRSRTFVLTSIIYNDIEQFYDFVRKFMPKDERYKKEVKEAIIETGTQVLVDLLSKEEKTLFNVQEKLSQADDEQRQEILERIINEQTVSLYPLITTQNLPEENYQKGIVLEQIIKNDIEQLYPFVRENIRSVSQEYRGDILNQILGNKRTQLYDLVEPNMPKDKYYKAEVLEAIMENEIEYFYHLVPKKMLEEVGIGVVEPSPFLPVELEPKEEIEKEPQPLG